MWVDVLKLREWYRTMQGRLVRRSIRRQLQTFLPQDSKLNILGLGYCQPYLSDYEKSRTTFLAMPAQMGVTAWPENGKSRSLLVRENALPFYENTFDTILICHCLEMASDAKSVLDACWHALRPDGQVIIMVPNRAGAWARREETIFAHGHPYSPGQLNSLLNSSSFTITQCQYALFLPPFNWRWVFRLHNIFEKIGRRWQAPVGGVILLVAKKDIFGMKVVRPSRDKIPSMVGVPASAN